MRRRDGEEQASGTVSVREMLGGVLGKSVPEGDRRYDPGTDETHITISGAAYAEALGGSAPEAQRRDGVTVQFRGGYDRPAEALRFNRIRELRERAGLTISDLAQASFIPVPALQRYEDTDEGTDVPAAARDNLAGAFGVPVSDLFPERRHGVTTSDGWHGLPSLEPTPPPERHSINDPQRYADMRMAQAAAIIDASREARSAAELEAATDRVRELQRDLEIHGLRARAAELGRKLEAI
jgi:transcriptional regulator with XRE-family HTH domain